MASLFGKEEASAAQRMIRETQQQVIGQAKKSVRDSKTAFESFDRSTQDDNRAQGSALARASASSLDALVVCPACGSQALVKGKRVRTGEPKTGDDEVIVEIAVLPLSLICYSCGLKLRSHGLLSAVELGGQYSVVEKYDPADYYGIEFDPADYFEPEYMNE